MSILRFVLGLGLLLVLAEQPQATGYAPLAPAGQRSVDTTGPALQLLGTLQDGGAPHIGCQKSCCAALFRQPDPDLQVIALGLGDGDGAQYLFEATPDAPRQMQQLQSFTGSIGTSMPDAIFLTHAHIGHYAGLLYLGKEALGANRVPVYAMPRMRAFLRQNGPWSQLVQDSNIVLRQLRDQEPVILPQQITVTPLRVPHRDEYSETVGYRIEGPRKAALFIPDIDKWSSWERRIEDEIRKVDYAFLDATFYSGTELDNRDMRDIPHPFVLESMQRFQSLPAVEREKIIFIHLNHTNPILDPNSRESQQVLQAGFQIGRTGQVFPL